MKHPVPLSNTEIVAVMKAIYTTFNTGTAADEIGSDVLAAVYERLDTIRKTELLCDRCGQRPRKMSSGACGACHAREKRRRDRSIGDTR